jgi:pterin-4a-carbinolamine dehydratase
MAHYFLNVFRTKNILFDEKSNKRTTIEDSPVSWAKRDNLTFIAEKVSHHPPIIAFYAGHYNNASNSVDTHGLCQSILVQSELI